MSQAENRGPRMRIHARLIEVKAEFSGVPWSLVFEAMEQKQKETLLRNLYIPLAVGLDGLSIIFAILMGVSGAWLACIGIVAIAGVWNYVVVILRNQARAIGSSLKALSEPEAVELPTEDEGETIFDEKDQEAVSGSQ